MFENEKPYFDPKTGVYYDIDLFPSRQYHRVPTSFPRRRVSNLVRNKFLLNQKTSDSNTVQSSCKKEAISKNIKNAAKIKKAIQKIERLTVKGTSKSKANKAMKKNKKPVRPRRSQRLAKRSK